MNKYLLDTSIIIDYLRNHKPTVKIVDDLLLKNSQFYISVLTQAELYAGLSTKKPVLKQALAVLTVSFKKIPLDENTAIEAGYLKRDCSVTLIDAIIAATAIKSHMTLLTRDKDFLKVKGLHKIKII